VKSIIKHLTVASLEIRDRTGGRYALELWDPATSLDEKSCFTLTAQDMIRFGLDPREELTGATMELTLKAVSYSRESHTLDTVLITSLSRSNDLQYRCSSIRPDKWEQQTCRLKAKTPVAEGTLVLLPPTYYELNLRLNEGEYRRLRSLPADSALELSLRSAHRAFRDIVLKWRGVLSHHRVFPKDYTAKMIPLVKSMVSYFNGDVDIVGHYCGLELMDKRETAGTVSPLSNWRWHREYFAVDPLSRRNWETPFAERVAEIDAILKRRFRNRLPIHNVRHFYDKIETHAWESKKWHPVDELSVGLEARYVSRASRWLPCITVEARSVDGNRKACEEICSQLCGEAAGLFRVKFDHESLMVEEFRNEAKTKGDE
jgi:hypothetical protein